MRFETLSEQTRAAWDAFCDESDEAWLWHKSIWMDYQRAYRPDLNPRELSFLIFDQDGGVLGICPLVLEEWDGGKVRELSFSASHLPSPALRNGLTPRRHEEVRKMLFARIDELAREHRVARSSFRVSPLLVASGPVNQFIKFGYLDVSLHSQLIETSHPLEELRKGVRKGHWSDIKRATALLNIEVLDQRSITHEAFKRYQALHALAAGRATRPQRTFDLMHQMIQEGYAILLEAAKEGKFIGYSFVLLYKNRAYYSSAANDPAPEYSELAIAHAIQWKTIEWLNARAYALYEIGWQFPGNQLHDLPSTKELNLSHFKRGFGGKTVPLFMSEKYFNREYCDQILTARVKKYVAALASAD